MVLIPLFDWLALMGFFLLWIGYHFFSNYWAQSHISLLGQSNRLRKQWMLRITEHEMRVGDAALINSLTSSPTFFASTTIIIIGGLFALLGTSDRVVEVVSELPFSRKASGVLWDMKIILLIAVFVYAFFRFTWSLRQYNFCAVMIGAAPSPNDFDKPDAMHQRDDFVKMSGALIGFAAQSYNDGLRSYYFAIAASGWFLSPVVLLGATVVVVGILYYREFHSKTLQVIFAQS
ncbi:DUF599 domain-containing protein [Ampullimonas aquatilis]|uniref:DUF599 domain-containing protein n=1 Tax=Ampullimonas aquatilis TaxID=1341549 RepID=UPI003C750B95